jgi:hypothetical protein
MVRGMLVMIERGTCFFHPYLIPLPSRERRLPRLRLAMMLGKEVNGLDMLSMTVVIYAVYLQVIGESLDPAMERKIVSLFY